MLYLFRIHDTAINHITAVFLFLLRLFFSICFLPPLGFSSFQLSPTKTYIFHSKLMHFVRKKGYQDANTCCYSKSNTSIPRDYPIFISIKLPYGFSSARVFSPILYCWYFYVLERIRMDTVFTVWVWMCAVRYIFSERKYTKKIWWSNDLYSFEHSKVRKIVWNPPEKQRREEISTVITWIQALMKKWWLILFYFLFRLNDKWLCECDW